MNMHAATPERLSPWQTEVTLRPANLGLEARGSWR